MLRCLDRVLGPYRVQRPKCTWIPQQLPVAIKPHQCHTLSGRKLNKSWKDFSMQEPFNPSNIPSGLQPLVQFGGIEIGCLSWVLSIMPTFPEISVRVQMERSVSVSFDRNIRDHLWIGVQMERSVSVSSDRNIRDHLWRWSTYIGWNIPTKIYRSVFDKLVLCPNLGIRKRNKKWQ